MSYGLSAPTSGALGWWDTSFDVSAPGGSKAADVAADTSSSSNDGWGGFWQGLAQNVTGYLIARDAAKQGVGVQAPAVAGAAPVYVSQPAASAGIPPVLLLAGLGLVVYLAVKD